MRAGLNPHRAPKPMGVQPAVTDSLPDIEDSLSAMSLSSSDSSSSHLVRCCENMHTAVPLMSASAVDSTDVALFVSIPAGGISASEI